MKPHLPECIYRRKDKIGFATPENAWLQQNSDSFRSLINEEMAGVFDVNRLNREWSELTRKQTGQGALSVWRLLNLALWTRQVR